MHFDPLRQAWINTNTHADHVLLHDFDTLPSTTTLTPTPLTPTLEDGQHYFTIGDTLLQHWVTHQTHHTLWAHTLLPTHHTHHTTTTTTTTATTTSSIEKKKKKNQPWVLWLNETTDPSFNQHIHADHEKIHGVITPRREDQALGEVLKLQPPLQMGDEGDDDIDWDADFQ